MNLSLQGRKNVQTGTFEYTTGGDGEYMNIFDRVSDFNWNNKIASLRSSQPRGTKMKLTYNATPIRIISEFQSLKFEY